MIPPEPPGPPAADADRIRTGIRNLDYVLTGGLRRVGGRAPSVLVRGSAGAGKSVLCSTIARNLFYRCARSVAYFALEQHVTDVRAMLAGFGDDRPLAPVRV